MKKEMTCCFTGHRKLTLQQTCDAYDKTVDVIKSLAGQGYKHFCCGGALGYDTLAAQAVIELRRQLDINLVLILPCINQDAKWNERDRRLYNEIKQSADKIVYTEREYTRGCMHKRNRALVDCSSICVCCKMHASGGTAYTVDYAQKRGLEIINVMSDGKE